MMNFEDMKDVWAAYDKKLETSLRLTIHAVHASHIGKVRSALDHLARWVGIELAVNLIGVIALGIFIFEHIGEPAFLIPAIALDAMAIFQVAFGGYQLAALSETDYSASVLALQKRLATLRIRRVRVTQWTLLLSPLLWIPLLVVTLKGLLGVNAYVIFDTTWLIANILFGVGFIVVGWWVSKYLSHRFQRSPRLQRLMDDVAGRSLTEAIGHLKQLSDIETEIGAG